MEVEDFGKAIEVTRAHLPDASDVEVNLFLRDVHDFFANNRPILSSVLGLQESVHRSVVELTETKAALVRQRAGLFGVLAVVGLILAIIAPFMGGGFINLLWMTIDRRELSLINEQEALFCFNYLSFAKWIHLVYLKVLYF
jgi:hypothetical protein